MEKEKQHADIELTSPISKSIGFDSVDTFINIAKNIGFSSGEIECLIKSYSHTKNGINE